mmetsp:Transcript_78424/g.95967  ORF Transcript_78424/g.95967 Transcript_78424/m.95967 type:complete len:307 (+) Transcript_78424:196-1116(+)
MNNNNNKNSINNICDLILFNCNECNKNIGVHKKICLPMMLNKSKNASNDAIKLKINKNEELIESKQCLYKNCLLKKDINDIKFECEMCSNVSKCKNCNIFLCKKCRINLKVLICDGNNCNEFICSQQCFNEIVNEYLNALKLRNVNIQAHNSMQLMRQKLTGSSTLATVYLGGILRVTDVIIPFNECAKCRKRNCGCSDYSECYHCGKCYCNFCILNWKEINKCSLNECINFTCCNIAEWNKNCFYCTKTVDCGLIFCTKGQCSMHQISNELCQNNSNNNNNSNAISNDIMMDNDSVNDTKNASDI